MGSLSIKLSLDSIRSSSLFFVGLFDALQAREVTKRASTSRKLLEVTARIHDGEWLTLPPSSKKPRDISRKIWMELAVALPPLIPAGYLLRSVP